MSDEETANNTSVIGERSFIRSFIYLLLLRVFISRFFFLLLFSRRQKRKSASADSFQIHQCNSSQVPYFSPSHKNNIRARSRSDNVFVCGDLAHYYSEPRPFKSGQCGSGKDQLYTE